MDTNVQNYESLSSVQVKLFGDSGQIGSTQTISVDELIMYDFNLMIDLPSTPNTLNRIEIIPIFRTDAEFSPSNNIGVFRFEFTKWDEQMTGSDGFMEVPLSNILITDPQELEIAYVFNEQLDYLELPDGVKFGWHEEKDEYDNVDYYMLRIPNTYKNPENA